MTASPGADEAIRLSVRLILRSSGSTEPLTPRLLAKGIPQ
jgi:hypothetical protein